MNIEDIDFDSIRFLSFFIEDNTLYIEYENGYTNRIAIDFESYIYIQVILKIQIKKN